MAEIECSKLKRNIITFYVALIPKVEIFARDTIK
jgi:hypothetical protein